MSELWTDERIDEWIDDHWDGAGAAEAIAKELRDDLQKRIAELEAELAAARRYAPVEDGRYPYPNAINVFVRISDDGETVELINLNYDEVDQIVLPKTMRVCRVAGEGEGGNDNYGS